MTNTVFNCLDVKQFFFGKNRELWGSAMGNEGE